MRDTRREVLKGPPAATAELPLVAWAVVDACAAGSNESAGMLTFRAMAAVAYGAQGLRFNGAAWCGAATNSPELLDTLALVGQMLTGTRQSGWANKLMGLEVLALVAREPSAIPGSVAVGGPDSLVQGLGPNLLVGTQTHPHRRLRVRR
jgi:hypothetical protein